MRAHGHRAIPGPTDSRSDAAGRRIARAHRLADAVARADPVGRSVSVPGIVPIGIGVAQRFAIADPGAHARADDRSDSGSNAGTHAGADPRADSGADTRADACADGNTVTHREPVAHPVAQSHTGTERPANATAGREHRRVRQGH